jgi:hypothetical protein
MEHFEIPLLGPVHSKIYMQAQGASWMRKSSASQGSWIIVDDIIVETSVGKRLRKIWDSGKIEI